MKRISRVLAICAAFSASFSAPSLTWAAINNDWPDTAKSCKEVTHSDPAKPPEPLWKRTAACATGFFTARPIHITVESTVPGGGTGVGPTVEADFNADRWQNKLVATEVTSLRGFWIAEGKFRATHDKFGINNSARDRFAVDLYANARDLPQMAYYGIGPYTNTTGLTDFRERDVTAGVDVFNPFSAWMAVGGGVESIWPQVTGTTDPSLRSITTAYNETTAPGITDQPDFVHYEVYGEPRRTRGKFEFVYKVSFNVYQDTQTGHYTFRRFFVDGTHTFHPTGSQDEILTIHDRLSISGTSGSNAVPFYLMETLGGSNLNGDPTLRGFADYRFRANDQVLIQTEYDRRIRGPIGVLGFYDVGQVANKVSDLSFSDMRQSFGFGLGVWAGGRIWFKAYVGLGSGEGRHTYFGIPSF